MKPLDLTDRLGPPHLAWYDDRGWKPNATSLLVPIDLEGEDDYAAYGHNPLRSLAFLAARPAAPPFTLMAPHRASWTDDTYVIRVSATEWDTWLLEVRAAIARDRFEAALPHRDFTDEHQGALWRLWVTGWDPHYGVQLRGEPQPCTFPTPTDRALYAEADGMMIERYGR